MGAGWRSLAILIAVLACGEGRVEADEVSYQSYRAGIGYHYSSGDYGGTSTTNIVYVPVTARAEVGRWTLWGTIPYLRISGPGGIIQGPDGPIQTVGGVSEGLGDILMRGSYFFPSATPWIPLVELIGVVKLPTASASKGLGTGEFDVGAETELTWTIGDLSPFAMVGYRFLGSSPTIELNNVVESSIGAQYRIVHRTNLGLMLDYRQAASATSGERLELVPFASFRVQTHWAVDLYTSVGFADGSPKAGVGFQVSYIVANFE